DWIAAEPGDNNGSGFYREESQKAKVVRIQVGLWKSMNSDTNTISGQVGYNNQGVEVGSRWYYYDPTPTTKPGQVSQIQVYYGRTIDAVVDGIALGKLTFQDRQRLSENKVVEVIKFYENGSLMSWLRTEADGRQMS